MPIVVTVKDGRVAGLSQCKRIDKTWQQRGLIVLADTCTLKELQGISESELHKKLQQHTYVENMHDV